MPKSHRRNASKGQRGGKSSAADRRQNLYRRARSLAEFLDTYYQGDDFLADCYKTMQDLNLPSTYRTAAEVDASESTLLQAIEDACANLSAYWVVPAIHQFVVDHYSFEQRNSGDRVVVLPPFKILAAKVFTASVGREPPRWPEQHASLRRAAALAFAYEQVTHIRDLQTVDPRSVVSATPEGFEYNGVASSVIDGMNAAYAGGGLVQRFANGTTEAMFRNPNGFLSDVWNVLAGDLPSSRETFNGTHLGEFPDAAEAPEFWTALAARLQLLMTAQQASARAGTNGLAILGASIQLFGGPALYGTTDSDAAGVQAAMTDCFWKPDRLVDTARVSEQFVFRPIARIAWDRELFATSTLTVADSLTTLAEQAVSPTIVDTDVRLPAKYFEKLLSGPFEDKVVQEFRALGFVAGEVTSTGSWRTQTGRSPLVGDLPLSGQIDLLAWRADGLMIVGECKVLQLASTQQALVNQWQRIGPADTDGFRRKLRTKAEWALSAVPKSGRPVTEIHRIIILDRPLHFNQPGDDVTVIDADALITLF